jgi:hypothetical protein
LVNKKNKILQRAFQFDGSINADSHIVCRAHAVPIPCPCRAHAVPMPCPCRAHAFPLPCRAHALLRQCCVLRESPCGNRKYPNCYSKSLTDRLFCSVLLPLFTDVGMDRCEGDWYASDNNLQGTPRGSRKKSTRAGSPQAVCQRPFCAVALRRTAWSEHGLGAEWQVWIRHGRTV